MVKSNTTPLEIEFDLDQMTAQDLSDVAEAESSLKLGDAAAIYARFATSCSLGDPKDPNTYLRQKINVYWQVSRAFGKAIADEASAEKK